MAHVQPSATECQDETCGTREARVWHCVDCDMRFCDICWARQGPHQRGRTGLDGSAHQKTSFEVLHRVKSILTPPDNQEELGRLHAEDEDTTWFDAGKSTLVNLLIRYQEGRLGIRGDGQFLTPVIGSKINGKLPTSVDVHLYADPASYRSDLPILYADSEGLQSGEKTPVGARLGSRSHSSAVPSRHSYRRKKRPISWADNDNTRKRETFESSVLLKLLDWGAAALETSTNQPTLPHVVVVLNSTDAGVDPQE
ncbi:hypothetical protein M8818_001278 [Zalaria obscura]|uniref:Uncharacterized protein n=1 Tax=Zalaria obscura TaxID=2024903 RepID=A0ACC3SLA8_9PEZI